VTRASVREYTGVQRERYLRATRAEKWQLLDEVVAVAHIHHKAAIQFAAPAAACVHSALASWTTPCYGPEVAAAAEVLWQASGRIGAHRLALDRRGGAANAHRR
jgi:hypothetical protein